MTATLHWPLFPKKVTGIHSQFLPVLIRYATSPLSAGSRSADLVQLLHSSAKLWVFYKQWMREYRAVVWEAGLTILEHRIVMP